MFVFNNNYYYIYAIESSGCFEFITFVACLESFHFQETILLSWIY